MTKQQVPMTLHEAEWADKYVSECGWDFACIEATAERGVSSADADELTERQCEVLLAWCKSRVAEDAAKERRLSIIDGPGIDSLTVECTGMCCEKGVKAAHHLTAISDWMAANKPGRRITRVDGARAYHE